MGVERINDTCGLVPDPAEISKYSPEPMIYSLFKYLIPPRVNHAYQSIKIPAPKSQSTTQPKRVV